MHKRLIYVLSLLAVVGILAMMVFTTPSGVGPFGVLVFFLMLYVVFFGIASGGVALFRKISKEKSSERKDYFYAAIIGFGPIILLLARSFGLLNVFTFGVSILFVVLGCFLVKNRLDVLK